MSSPPPPPPNLFFCGRAVLAGRSEAGRHSFLPRRESSCLTRSRGFFLPFTLFSSELGVKYSALIGSTSDVLCRERRPNPFPFPSWSVAAQVARDRSAYRFENLLFLSVDQKSLGLPFPWCFRYVFLLTDFSTEMVIEFVISRLPRRVGPVSVLSHRPDSELRKTPHFWPFSFLTLCTLL